MKYWFYAFIFINSSLTWASLSEVTVFRSENSKKEKFYYLSAPSCYELKNELSAFSVLKRKYDKGDSVLNSDKDLCEDPTINGVILTDYLPTKMNQIFQATQEYYGPNCWNSVLYLNDLNRELRFTLPNEFQQTLAFHGCRIKNTFEEVEPGDIVRLFDKNNDFEEYHSFIYITKNISFSKSGPQTRASYGLFKTSEVLETFDYPKNCLEDLDCRLRLIIQDCSTKKETIEEPVDPILDRLIAEVNLAEKDLSHIIFNYHKLGSGPKRDRMINGLTQKVQNLYQISFNDLNRRSPTHRLYKLEVLLISRLTSMIQQLDTF